MKLMAGLIRSLIQLSKDQIELVKGPPIEKVWVRVLIMHCIMIVLTKLVVKCMCVVNMSVWCFDSKMSFRYDSTHSHKHTYFCHFSYLMCLHLTDLCPVTQIMNVSYEVTSLIFYKACSVDHKYLRCSLYYAQTSP